MMGDDGLPVKTASESYEMCKGVELRQWLRRYNKGVSRKIEKIETGHRQYRTLINGLEREKQPEKELISIIKFASPGKVEEGRLIDSSLNTNSAGKAIFNVLRGDSNISRYNAGIHPVTLMTEQKRKVIISALTDQGHETEDRALCQAKVAYHIEKSSEGDDEDSHFLDMISTKSGHSSSLDSFQRSGNGTVDIKTTGSLKSKYTYYSDSIADPHFPPIKVENKPFKAKWDHYDTMRARWTYIQPQTKHLVSEECTKAPTTNQRYVMVDNKPLNGDVNDVSRFESLHSDKQKKTMRISNHNQKLARQKALKNSKYYKPSPCVFY